MNKNDEKNALNGANIESGNGSTYPIAFKDSISNSEDNTTVYKSKPKFIESLLPHGAENAVSTDELLQVTGLCSSRSLKHVVSRERKQGACILSLTNGGYFLPADGEQGIEERRRFVATIRAKAFHTLEAAKPALDELSMIDGQLSMEELLRDDGEIKV